MSISVALDIARRALVAQETALGVVGHNIANVNTPGYTRQVPEFVSEPGRPAGGNVVVGGGVRIAEVVQVVDPLLARRRLAADTDQGEQTARRDQLRTLGGVVNDLTQPSLAGAVDGFFDAADALSRNPTGLAERQALLGRATAVATELNRRGNGIANLQRAADDQVVSLVDQTNAQLDRIAELNRTIVASEIDGQPANDLRDERTSLLNDVAGRIGINVVEDDRGAVRVSSTAGPVLVESDTVVHRLAVQAGTGGLDGSILHQLGIAGGTGNFLDIPTVFGSGALAGLLDVRDDVLVTAATNLDTVAGAFRDAVNAIQTDPAARDLDGNATTATPLFTGTGARALTVAITDPRQLAAALSTDPADNTNALRLADLRTTAPAAVATTSAPALALGGMSVGEYLAGELGRVGDQVSRAEDAASASDLLAKQLESDRLALSGVNLNEELTDLLKYQRGFQAAAQVLNVTNSTLDDLFRLV